MRIKEEFKEYGYFWLPSVPDKRIPGILSISDGGSIELEVFGVFGEYGENSKLIERIVRHIRQEGFITLDGCYRKSLSYSPDKSRTFDDISKSSIDVTRVFSGVAYREGEIPCFNTLTFSIEGIDEWVEISGIEDDYQFEKHTATISYQLPTDVPLRLDNGMELSIAFAWNPQFLLNRTEAGIVQKTYFQLVSQDTHELDEFISVANKLTAFLCFAVNKIVCLDSTSTIFDTLHQDVRENLTSETSVDIYFRSQFHSKDEPEIYRHEMLFGFEEIQNDIERKINKWINAYEQITPAFHFYFWTRMGAYPYSEVKFLTLVQGLEAYHRKMFNENRMSLRNRIEEIIEPFKDIIGTDEERQELITSIMDTRNYWTHYNPKLELKAAKGRNLEVLCSKIEAFFQLHFLQLIGFNQEEIRSIGWNCQELRWKLQF